MKKDLRVSLDQLKQGHTHKIKGIFDPMILEVDEPELRFAHPISLQGEIHLSDGHLVVHLNACTQAQMPCSICNEMTTFEINVANFRQAEPEEELPDSLEFDVGPTLREALLLEIPKSMECNSGSCPRREEISPYLASEKSSEHFPFKNIKL